jgi:EmrB/QacA subfamily drug resistance transporter
MNLLGRTRSRTMNVQRGTLAVVCLATAVLMLDIAVVNTALPHIASDLHASLGGVQWVVDAYTLALASVVLTAGSVADRIGRKLVFSVGLVMFTASSIACAMAGSIEVLDVARGVQGIGGALLFATSLSLLAEAFPRTEERVKALAAYGASIGAAFAFGPLVGGALTSGFGWQAVFLVNVPLGVIGLFATARWVRESRDANARGLDWWGQVTLSAGLFLLVLGLLRGNEDGWSSTPILAELGGAAVLLVVFVWVQRRVKSPMLPLGLFRRADFSGAQVAAFAISASFFALFLYMTLYLQNILGLSAIETGLVYMPGTLVMFVVSGMSAQVATKVAPGVMIAGGLTLVAAGLALFLNVDEHSSWTALEPGFLLASIGTGVFNPAVSAVALGSAPQHMSGLAAGVNDTFRQAGIAVGVAAFGAMIPSSAGLGAGDPVAFVDGMHVALIVGAALAAVGAIASARLLGLGRAAGAVPQPAAS